MNFTDMIPLSYGGGESSHHLPEHRQVSQNK